MSKSPRRPIKNSSITYMGKFVPVSTGEVGLDVPINAVLLFLAIWTLGRRFRPFRPQGLRDPRQNLRAAFHQRLDHLLPSDRFRFLPCTDQCISCSAGLLRRPLGCSVPLYVCMCPYAGCLTLLLHRFPIGSPAGCKLYI